MTAAEFDTELNRTVRAVRPIAGDPTADDYAAAMAGVAEAVAGLAAAEGRMVVSLVFTIDNAIRDRERVLLLTAVGTARLIRKTEIVYRAIGGRS